MPIFEEKTLRKCLNNDEELMIDVELNRDDTLFLCMSIQQVLLKGHDKII